MEFHQASNPSILTEPPATFKTRQVEVYNSTDISEATENLYNQLIKKIDKFQEKGSGWVVHQLLELEFIVHDFVPLRGRARVELSEELEAKHAVVNFLNDDDFCFLYGVTAAVYGNPNEQHRERPALYREHFSKWNLKGIEMPMQCTEGNLRRFENQNDISVSVYGWEDGKTNEAGVKDPGYAYVLYPTREIKSRHADLLLVSDGVNQHYCWITNFSRFVGSQYSRNNGELAYCRFCLHGFYGKAVHGECTRLEDAKRRRDEHEKECFIHGGQKTSFPKDPTIRFKSTEKQLEAPFVLYADFESLLQPVDKASGKRTVKYEEHVACSYAYLITSRIPGVEFPPRIYVGLDAAEHFLTSLQNDLNTLIMPIIERNVEMIWDEDAQQRFDEATHCFICNEFLDRENSTPAKDHCHFTGVFRGAAHKACNLNYKIDIARYLLYIIFHNLRGYDCHLLMQAVRRRHGRIDVIPHNYERYLSFTIGRLRFLDSFQFLSYSLEALAKQMSASDFAYTTRFFPDASKRALMLRKGAYPYDHMKTMAQFDETALPPQSAFYNRLSDEPLSNSDYEHACTVWNVFNCATMRDYHDLYLKSDVYLLADVFEKFRFDSQALYGLEPTHYYSLPGLSWDAALKHSGVELELITDIDMYLMIEKGIFGGIAMISRRYAEANDPRMGDQYDPSKPTKTLLYMDANSLYPTAMCMPLPIDEFSMLENPETLDVMQVEDDAEYGFILEIDGYTPDEKHDQFSDYPLTAEKMTVSRDLLSPFQKEHFPTGKGTEKLVPHLGKLEKYVVHYCSLKLWIKLGFKLTKIHRAIRFRQGAWLKSFMELNIEKRREAALNGDKARVGTTKLAMNAIFGKTMENVRKHVNIELITSNKIALKRFSKPNFKGSKRFHDELIGVELKRLDVELSKPIQCGLTILGKAKNVMVDGYYNEWKPHFPKSDLLFTDTDSFCVAVEHPDVYSEMAKFKDWFDFSEYPKDHPLYDDTNCKVVGKFKDELHGACMTRFVGLRPKLYSFEYLDENGAVQAKNTAKGVQKVMKSRLKFDDYMECLQSMRSKTISMNAIRSDKHKLFTYNVNKIGLSAFDDKRFICDDGVATFDHGHWRTTGQHISGSTSTT